MRQVHRLMRYKAWYFLWPMADLWQVFQLRRKIDLCTGKHPFVFVVVVAVVTKRTTQTFHDGVSVGLHSLV